MKKDDKIKYTKLFQDVYMNLKYQEIQNLPSVKSINEKLDELEAKKDNFRDKFLVKIKKLYMLGAQHGFTKEEIDKKYQKMEEKFYRDIKYIDEDIKLKKLEKQNIIQNLDQEKYNTNPLKEFYPILFEEFEREFENLFNTWLKISRSKKIIQIKNDIKNILEHQLLNNLYAQPYLVNSIEKNDRSNIDRLAFSLINQPLRLLNLILGSINQDEDYIEREIEELKKTFKDKRFDKSNKNTRPGWDKKIETKVFKKAKKLKIDKGPIINYPYEEALKDASKILGWLIPEKYLDKSIYDKDKAYKNTHINLKARFRQFMRTK